MALNGTMVAIQTVTVGSGGAGNITFSNIPQTYTDLKIVASLREAGGSLTVDLRFNGDTGNNYSWRRIQGAGSGVPNSDNGSSVSSINISVLSGLGDTASTFGSLEYYIPNYTASTNKSVSGDSVTENNATTAYQRLGAGLWSSSSAITSIALTNSSGQNFVQHSTATLYGISKVPEVAKAYGGEIAYDSQYVYHTFKISGTFTPLQNLTCDIVVVAGGGSGGRASSNRAGGGGGAGGLLFHASQSITAQNYVITIGGGGTAIASGTGNNGSNSQFGSLTASVGGGYGGVPGTYNGNNGGSGGGGADNNSFGNGNSGQGNAGALGFDPGSGTTYAGGGGGGAGGAGSAGASANGGSGGAGINYSSWGSTTLAVGGRGGSSSTVLTNGTENTGTGGTGGFNNNGGNGGSGVVIVRYAK